MRKIGPPHALVVTAILAVPAWAQKADTKLAPTDPAPMEHGTMDHSAMDHAKMEAGGKREAAGTGVINSISAETNSINITHDPMPEFGWPQMTMDLPVTRKVDLSGVKSGDKVTFKLKLGRDKTYRIIKIAPVE